MRYIHYVVIEGGLSRTNVNILEKHVGDEMAMVSSAVDFGSKQIWKHILSSPKEVPDQHDHSEKQLMDGRSRMMKWPWCSRLSTLVAISKSRTILLNSLSKGESIVLCK